MNRKGLVLLLFLGHAHAQSGVEERVLFCSSVGDDEQKLACYESIADSIRSPERPPAPVVSSEPERKPQQNQTVAVERPRPDDSFGRIKKRERVDEVSGSIAEVKYDARGRIYVRLDSGQIWRQVDTDRVTLSKGDKVVIKRGALSAYFMTPEGSNKRIKVRRQE